MNINTASAAGRRVAGVVAITDGRLHDIDRAPDLASALMPLGMGPRPSATMLTTTRADSGAKVEIPAILVRLVDEAKPRPEDMEATVSGGGREPPRPLNRTRPQHP